jgi:serine/threonine protein kinase
VVGVGAIVAIVFFVVRRRRKNVGKANGEPDEFDPDGNKVNPVSGTGYEQMTAVHPSGEYGAIRLNAPDTVVEKPVVDKFKIEYNEVDFGSKIGAGQFGIVYKGMRTPNNIIMTTISNVKVAGEWRGAVVAIKETQSANMEEFKKEAELMKGLQPHKNIAQIYGVCQKADKLYVVMEFLPGGSLEDVLHRKKSRGKSFTAKEKVKLASGIASGMIHLHAEKILHRDLAARNILISSERIPKISDFGMSHVSSNQDFGDVDKNITSGPIRWMAPESLGQQVFSSKTDVFSYGILLWGMWPSTH